MDVEVSQFYCNARQYDILLGRFRNNPSSNQSAYHMTTASNTAARIVLSVGLLEKSLSVDSVTRR